MTATQDKKAKHKLPKPTVPKKAILAGMGSDLKPMSMLSNTKPPVKRKKGNCGGVVSSPEIHCVTSLSYHWFPCNE